LLIASAPWLLVVATVGFVDQPLQDVFVPVGIVLERTEPIPRFRTARNTSVEFGHSVIASCTFVRQTLKGFRPVDEIESMTGHDRDRGVLSSADRRFLRSPEEYSRQATREREKYIKERVWNAFLDGSILSEHTTAARRREIFDGWDDFAQPVSAPGDEDRPDNFADVAQSRGEFVEKIRADVGFSSWISFLYLGLSESDEFDFEPVLRTGIERAEESRGRVVTDLDFRVDTRERRSLDELKSRLERRQRLTTEEIQRLRSAGELTNDELVTYYNELGGPVRFERGE